MNKLVSANFCKLICRKFILLGLLLVASTGALFSQPARDQQTDDTQNQPEYVENEIIVQIKATAAKQAGLSHRPIYGATGMAAFDALNNRYGVRSAEPAFKTVSQKAANAAKADQFGLTRTYVLTVSVGTDIEEAIAEYAKLPEVAYAEPNLIRTLNAIPNDPLYASQWALNNTGQAIPYNNVGTVGTPGADINAQLAWDLHTGDNSIILAIIDSGVDYNHPDFAGRMVPGYDFYNNDNDPMDDNGHGTACAGIAAATGNNGIGVAGVNWNCKIMPLKAGGSGNSLTLTAIVNSINYAADNGAHVLSMSFGGGYSATEEAAVNYAHSMGCILVASRGNGNSAFANYPASFANVMAIGAMSPCNERKSPSSCDGETFWGSSYGADLDVMAPGTRIHTTDILGAGGYSAGDYTATFNGTSSAAPFVAGVAALVRSYAPSLTNDDIRDVINSTAVDIGAAGFDIETGYGRVNAYAALNFALSSVPPQASVSPTGLSFTMDPDLTDSDVFTISNTGGANARNLFWNITYDPACTWLSIDKSSGRTADGANEQITVSINTLGMIAGNYQCTLDINSNDPDDPVIQVVVDLNVNSLPPPLANISPAAFSLSRNTGEVVTEPLTIANDAPTGNLNLHWSASFQGTDCNLMSLSQTSGVVAPGNADISNLTINLAGVSAGNYSCTIEITTNDPTAITVQIPVSVTVNVPVVGSNKLYVINGGGTSGVPEILRMDLDGSNPALMYNNHARPIDGDLDKINRKLYWFDWTNDALYKGDLNGTGQTTVIGGLTSTLVSIALDVPNNHMYYIAQSPQPPRIVRADLDGNNPTELIQMPGQYWVNDLVLDIPNGYMYWTNEGVWRAGIDGSNPIHLIPLDNYNANNTMAIDVAGGKVYWTQSYPNSAILRANLADGSNPEVLNNNPPLSSFYSLDLDLINNKIYMSGYSWDGSNYNGSIHRADLQVGATPELVYADPTLDFPHIILDVAEPCGITGLSAGNQTACDPADNTYTQDVTVTYANAPTSGTLDVNGQNFTITASPQTVTLVGLVSNGQAVNVTASFSEDPTCSLTETALFTAPENCEPCAITALAAGTQTACDPVTNLYTQQVTVTYAHQPASGTLDVNGQSYAITASPQTVTLIDLVSDGQAVDVTASFSAEPACSLTANALFTAPEACDALDICAEINPLIAEIDALLNNPGTPRKSKSKLIKAKNYLNSACDNFTAGEYDRGYNDLADAADELDKAMDKGANAGAIRVATVDLARLIATETIADAQAFAGDPAIDQLLSKAAEALADGDAERADDKFDKAVKEYGKAWEYAAEAIQLANDTGTGGEISMDLDPIIAAIDALLADNPNKKARKALQKAHGKVTDAQSKFDSGEIEDGYGKLEDAAGYLEDATDEGSDADPVIADLLSLGRDYAVAKITEAQTYAGTPEVDHQITKAQNYLSDGDSYAGQGKNEKAMDRYGKAWAEAQEGVLLGNGLGKTTVEPVVVIPTEYGLDQNYPNPFNPVTTIRFALPQSGNVTLKIFNLSGQLVRTLVSSEFAAGQHQIVWNGRNDNGEKVASGMYLYRITAGSFVQTKKMMLMK